jgi:hypothetical protein
MKTSIVSIHAKFMTLGMQVPHVIPDVPTKLHTQIQYILVVTPFLGPAMFDF